MKFGCIQINTDFKRPTTVLNLIKRVFIHNRKWYTLLFKSLGLVRFSMLITRIYSHYMIRNTIKTIIFWNIIAIPNNCFLSEHIWEYNVFLWSKLNYSSLQCHMILQKSFSYADLLLKKLYQCWKQLCCYIFLFCISISNKQHLFEK